MFAEINLSDLLDNTEQIIALIGLLATTLAFLAKWLGSKKLAKVANALNFFKVEGTKFIKEAETFVTFSGAQKKEWVLTKLNRAAIESNIPFDEVIVSNLIDELVAFTKTVNVKK